MSQTSAEPRSGEGAKKAACDLSRALILLVAGRDFRRHHGKDVDRFGFLPSIDLAGAVDIRLKVSSRLRTRDKGEDGNSS
jgi:hypothetical protein